MSNSGINRNVNTIISTLNKKADVNLGNSAKATEIENIANSAASAAESAATVAHAASELINTALPQKVNKNGDTFNGSVVIDGDLSVTGEINATITGSSESAMSATKDSNGNVIVDTYATKAQLNTTNTNVATNATNITTAQNRADAAYTLANSKVSSNNGTMTFSLDDYSVDFRRAGDDGNYTVSLVTNKTLDNTKIYNTLIDKTGKFLPEVGTDLSVNNATVSLKNSSGDIISSVTVNNVANATSAGTLSEVLPVAKGGTGSSTKNFVDLSSAQTIAGVKTFSSIILDSLNVKNNYYHKGCGTNFIPSAGDTTSGWSGQEPGYYWYTTDGILTDQPSQYGHLLNLGNGTEVFQLWCCAPSGPLYFRSGNGSSGWNGTTWKWLTDNTSQKASITSTYSSGTSWYRKYSDGWIEQGGYLNNTGESGTLTFNTTFASTNYTIIFQNFDRAQTDTGGYDWAITVAKKTVSNCFFGKQKSADLHWYACGF